MRFFTGIKNPDFISDPEGLCSKDECEPFVRAFMEHYFSYEENFVCISVRPDRENGNLADAYGFQFELNPEVMDDIVIACAGDFQNLILATFKGLLGGKDIDAYVGCFELLPPNAGRPKREKILMNALSNAKEARRQYVEARLYRPLRRTDCIDPDSGKLEFIAATVLAEDEED